MCAIFCTSVSQVPFMVADFRGSAAVRHPQDKIGGLIKRVKFYSMCPYPTEAEEIQKVFRDRSGFRLLRRGVYYIFFVVSRSYEDVKAKIVPKHLVIAIPSIEGHKCTLHLTTPSYLLTSKAVLASEPVFSRMGCYRLRGPELFSGHLAIMHYQALNMLPCELIFFFSLLGVIYPLPKYFRTCWLFI